ncbi:uncharacterized protein C8Q71DRAFT_720386 [Rhodofomes roseus]|uniref:DUF6532 domain-containing protein n=1 Tax=Rhodofomes roseus TaxID=34475 RepID=A0ABQ8KW02_9APHY|nr:uncharacterized protein C8Q71DRAFT_720386 [Rhodofomes roseus]KAH9843001.1 hypothetical protein C8Q71DRAFT_720386 [Rhodofomes roseus]
MTCIYILHPVHNTHGDNIGVKAWAGSRYRRSTAIHSSDEEETVPRRRARPRDDDERDADEEDDPDPMQGRRTWSRDDDEEDDPDLMQGRRAQPRDDDEEDGPDPMHWQEPDVQDDRQGTQSPADDFDNDAVQEDRWIDEDEPGLLEEDDLQRRSSPPLIQRRRVPSMDREPRLTDEEAEEDVEEDAEGEHGSDSDVENGSEIHSGRPRQKDYAEDVQQILTIACSIFRCHVSTINPFPDSALEMRWAQLAWGEACRELEGRYAASPSILRIIMARTSQTRSELKTKIKSLIENMYGFSDNAVPEEIIRNRERAENLKYESAFVYKEPALGQRDFGAREGMYRHPMIQKTINIMWFANKSDEGVCYRRFFDPLTIETIAFVLTAIQCGIDEWGTGIHADRAFAVNEYHPVYKTHKANLEAFDGMGDDAHGVLLDIRKLLHSNGRFHSGAESVDAGHRLTTLSRDALTAGLRQALEAKARNGQL